ncbi:universal stress protein [Georgenia sp. H159]|uniref:universal stress protein n=1 Tax=Georgenia sp. H159 TaxID=3076115 RepID=UPI002D773386|nr:universal stress protein [Georgenia sp. H159]
MDTEEYPTGSVVVGTDGSPPAERAVDFAAAEAARRGVGLHVLYAFPWLSRARAWEFAPSPDITETGERVVSAAVDRVRAAQPGLELTTEVRVYDPATALVEASTRASVVVVGARGQGEADEGVMGSVSQKVAAHARCAVVVVHGPSPAGPGAPVVVGMDPEDGAPEAMEYAFEEATRRGAKLVVVQGAQHDAAFPDFPDAVLSGQYDQTAGEFARITAERLNEWHHRFPDVPFELRLERERPVRALVAASAEASIVVVGTRARGGLAGLLLGSVSRGVANRAPVVALVRARHHGAAD